jgi:hypothetical protein
MCRTAAVLFVHALRRVPPSYHQRCALGVWSKRNYQRVWVAWSLVCLVCMGKETCATLYICQRCVPGGDDANVSVCLGCVQASQVLTRPADMDTSHTLRWHA